MLGALDADEHQQIEDQIESDPNLKDELTRLRQDISQLDDLEPPGTAPVGLARRTCEFVATLPATRVIENEQSDRADSPAVDLKLAPELAPKLAPSETQQSGRHRVPTTETEPAKASNKKWFRENSFERSSDGRNSVMNLVMVAVVLMLLATIALPVINQNRVNSRKLACQNNLRIVGQGLLDYADNSGGKYVSMPMDGKLAFTGVYAPKLLDGGFVEDPSAFMCAGVGSAIGRNDIPTIEQILAADKRETSKYQMTAGGDFAYMMGQMKNGVYDTGARQDRANFILLADNPGDWENDRVSNNHGGYGQNVFFEDGRVQFLEVPEFNGDRIYQNDFGHIGPGAHPNDIVLAPSGTRLSGFNVN